MEKIVIFGGASYEHEISIVSAIAIKKVLKTTPRFIFLSADRRFWLIEESRMKAETFAKGEHQKMVELFITQGGFEQRTFLGRKVIAGTVINLVHGGDGEDGKLAALLSFFGIHFVGPRLEASVLSFNKAYTKHLGQMAGVKTLKSQVLTRGETLTLAYPIILKPLRLGSSIGVSVVRSDADLAYALDVAFEFDDQVLAEPFVQGVREFNLAGCLGASGWQLSTIEEPAKNDLLDFDQKYLDFARTRQSDQAVLDEPLQEAMIEAFKRLYEQGFVGSLIRCDFFLIEDTLYLNEVNPIPGSLANYLFGDFEATLDDLCRALPQEKAITVDYRYIHQIRSAKGKA